MIAEVGFDLTFTGPGATWALVRMQFTEGLSTLDEGALEIATDELDRDPGFGRIAHTLGRGRALVASHRGARRHGPARDTHRHETTFAQGLAHGVPKWDGTRQAPEGLADRVERRAFERVRHVPREPLVHTVARDMRRDGIAVRARARVEREDGVVDVAAHGPGALGGGGHGALTRRASAH